MGADNRAAAERPDPDGSFWSLAALAPGLFLVVVGATAVALYAAFFAPLVYPYAGDSVAYIEAARSLLAGEPFLYSVPFGYASERQILRLWPPGFPTLIAAVSGGTGLDASTAGLWLTRLSVAALPIVAYWAIYRAAGTPIAVAAALLSVSPAGMLPYAHRVASDPSFAVVVMLSLGFLLRGLTEPRSRRSAWLLVIAGLLAGLSIDIRNSGIALVLAAGATIAALWLAKDGSFARLFRQAVCFALGLAVAVLPLMIWNLAAFGVLRPYEMSPSTIGVAQNIAQMIFAFVFDLLPILRAGGGLAEILQSRAAIVAPLAALGILAIVAAGLVTLRRHDPRDGEPRAGESPASQTDVVRLRATFMILAACYGLASIVITVAARSRYEWAGFIGYRHVAQFDWLLIAAGLCALAPWLDKWRATLVAVAAITLCVLGLRAWYLVGVYQLAATGSTDRPGLVLPPIIGGNSSSVSRPTMLAFARSPAAAALVASIPSQCEIVSNVGTVIQVDYKRRARQVYERGFKMADFANLERPSVLIFVSMPGLDIQSLQPPSPAYRTIRDPVFVAFEPAECR